MAYATLEEFKDYLRIPIDAEGGDDDDNSLMTLCLSAATDAVAQACGRDFEVAGEDATARYYTAVREGYTTYVYIDDITDTEDLLIESDEYGTGEYVEFEDYTIQPVNAPASTNPYTRIKFTTTSPVVRDGGLRVTARWGWTAVPDTIKLATLMQASRLFKRRDAPFGIAGSAEWGTALRMLPKLDPDVDAMLSPYRHSWWVV